MLIRELYVYIHKCKWRGCGTAFSIVYLYSSFAHKTIYILVKQWVTTKTKKNLKCRLITYCMTSESRVVKPVTGILLIPVFCLVDKPSRASGVTVFTSLLCVIDANRSKMRQKNDNGFNVHILRYSENCSGTQWNEWSFSGGMLLIIYRWDRKLFKMYLFHRDICKHHLLRSYVCQGTTKDNS